MVTNRHKVKNKGAACSPLTLSPGTPEGVVGGRGGVTFNSPAYGTRAAKMLEASVSLRDLLIELLLNLPYRFSVTNRGRRNPWT